MQVGQAALIALQKTFKLKTIKPVLGGSLLAGSFEDFFFACPGAGETDRMLKAVKCAHDRGRKLRREARKTGEILSAQERLIAAITSAAVRVYEELAMLARVCQGKVYPSFDSLADRTGLGRATVARAIAVLDRAGFLARQRRYTAGDEEHGPKWVQTSNAYRLLLPKFAASLLPKWQRAVPAPVDELDRHQSAHRDFIEQRESLKGREYAKAMAPKCMVETLARIAESSNLLPESQIDAQPRPKVYLDKVEKECAARTRYDGASPHK